jgi:predicted RNA-binding Zn-ribbon protein involved in translation (DUF1610 family)
MKKLNKKENKIKTCPRCGLMKMRDIEVQNALSRRDNKTHICSDCGTEEALVDAKIIPADEREANFKNKVS